MKSYLTPAANTQEISSYQTSFFHFWQNANFSPTFGFPFAVNLMFNLSIAKQQLFSFSRNGAKIWNGIPSELRQLKKHTLKVH